ncbi:MAG: phosphoesterase [Chloroflexi bacterium]|nr:phosphoesterase [Chloroflexota bacterium]
MSVDPLATGADEEIVGIPRDLALPAGAWTGIRAFSSPEEGEREITRLDGLAQARPRRELESDPSWKQPIPYAVALYRPEGIPAGDVQLFWMDRLAGGSDKRLHGRASFGVGGHISPSDGGIRAALAREWAEEVATPTLPHFTPLGLLNDDGDDVGRVHLGVVFIATLTSPLIHIRETHKLAGSLVPVSEALRRRDELEGWSARLIDTIAKVAASL